MGEQPSGTTLRLVAAVTAIAAGAIHLAQVRIHTDEDPLFGIFFAVVGALQIAGGLYLVRPLGPSRLARAVAAFGIAGSLATIGVWAASRTFGLPFGAEPGLAEEVGLADAAADLLELLTAASLALWLRYRATNVPRKIALGVSASAGLLAVVWVASRALGAFDPDPRLALVPELTDGAAVATLLAAAWIFALLGARAAGPLVRGGTLAGLVALAVLEVPLVAFTLPPRGGQNADCRYAPIGEESGHALAEGSGPVRMEVGDRRSVVVLLLVACADAPVRLESVVPLRAPAPLIEIEATSVDRSRPYLVDRVRDGPGPGAVPLAGLEMRPGTGRYPVTIEVRALARGELRISAFRVDYTYRGERGSFGFASFAAFCIGATACPEGP